MTPYEKAVSEIDTRTYMFNDENVIESQGKDSFMIDYQRGAELCTVFFTRKKWVNYLLKMAEEHPEEVTIKHKNKDGSIVAHMPISYLHIYRNKELTQEEKEKRSERFKRNVLKS